MSNEWSAVKYVFYFERDLLILLCVCLFVCFDAAEQ